MSFDLKLRRFCVSVCQSAAAAAAKYATVCPIKVTAQPLAESLFAVLARG